MGHKRKIDKRALKRSNNLKQGKKQLQEFLMSLPQRKMLNK